jgi:TorA maturation chaperone TorD
MAEYSENADMNKAAHMFKAIFPEDEEKLGEYLELSRLNRARDYTYLFVLGKQSVSQYSSVYLSPEHLLKQDSWSYAKSFYISNGFKVNDDCNIIEDHISIELQFMGLLCNQISEKLHIGDFDTSEKLLKSQHEFYLNHMKKWVPYYCNKIISKEEELHTRFYTSFAHLLKGFIVEDIQFIRELLD